MYLFLLYAFIVIACALYGTITIVSMGRLFGLRDHIPPWAVYLLGGILTSGYSLMTLNTVPLPLIYLMAIPVCFLAAHFTLQGSCLQHMFVSMSYVLHQVAVRGITLSLFAILTSRSLFSVVHTPLLSMLSMSFTVVICILYFLFVFPRFYPMEKLLYLLRQRSQLKLITLLQTSIHTLFALGSLVYYFPGLIWFSFYHLFAYIMLLSIFYFLFDFCISNSYLSQLESSCRLYEQLLQKQINAYETQMLYIQRIRAFKHEWINIKGSLLSTPAYERNKNLMNFLRQMDSSLLELTDSYPEYSGNPFIQAVLLHARASCTKLGIVFNAAAILPQCLPLDDLDLCRIFTNIINHALEAAGDLSHGIHKYIKITTSISPNWCTVTCENSYKPLQKEQGACNALKKDILNQGLGLKSIDAVLEKCGGFITTDSHMETGVFKLRIHIPVLKDAKEGGNP